jgi:para-aminobenzoate synthetase component 1
VKTILSRIFEDRLGTNPNRSIVEVPFTDPFDYFSSVSKGHEGEMLLDSNADASTDASVEALGRYTIAAPSPLFTVTVKTGIASLRYRGRVTETHADPKEIIALLSKMLPTVDPIRSPTHASTATACFDGGLVWLIPYEMNRYYEKVVSHPGDRGEDIFCAFHPSVRVFDLLEKKAWDVSYVSSAETVLPIPQEQAEPDGNGYFMEKFRCDESKESYLSKISNIKERIAEGETYQVNLSRKLSARFEGCALGLYADLRRINPAPFGAYINGGDFSLLSMSPELFFRVEGRRIETRPIKGTAPRSFDPGEDRLLKTGLENSEKDRAENVMIVDLMRNDLSKVCLPGSVKVPRLFGIESLPSIHHLVSVVEGELKKSVGLPEILSALFPGGSITGAPKIKSMEIISLLETSPRGYYCGAISACGMNGSITSSILIRTITIRGNAASYRTGGGITACSDPEAEYAETELKAGMLGKLSVKTGQTS